MPKFILETPRLRLREIEDTDFDALNDMTNDPAVEEYDFPGLRGPRAADIWIGRQKDRYARDGIGLWAVELKSDPIAPTGLRPLIGAIGIINHHISEVSELELGWHLKFAYWGKGYAKEAAAACRDYGFTTLNQPKLISLIRPTNEESIRVAKSIGMTHEKTIFIAKFNRETAVFSTTREANARG